MAAYYGDIHLGDTIDFAFTTTSASTGAPTTLSGVPVLSAYVGSSTTELTAGITLTVDFDTRTGMNHVTVVASSGNGYTAATNVDIVITTGTVGGTSAVGYLVGSFSIDKRGVNQILGTAVSTPATAGVLDVNAKNINNVSTSSVTTINANQGTTQPLNFTGTAASALVKGDMVDIAGAAVSTTTAQIGVNAVQLNGQTVTAAAGVTFPTSVASPTNITAGTITTVTNLTNAPTAGDFTATMKTSLNAATPVASLSGDFTTTMKTSIGTAVAASAVASVTGNVGGSVGSVTAAVTVTGDLSATMKTSVTTAATAATPTVLLTPGTATGQVSLTAGVVAVDLKKINGTTVNGNGGVTPWGP